MATLRRVAELNNAGASMLMASRDKDALKLFQTALGILEREMLVGHLDSAGTSTDEWTSISSTATDALAEQDTCISSSNEGSAARFCFDTKCSTEIPELKDDRYFIFNQALLVEMTPNGSSSCTPSDANEGTASITQADEPHQPNYQCLTYFYTSVVIYNIALAYHKRGMAPVATSAALESSSTTTTNSPPASFARQNDARQLYRCHALRLYEHCLKIARRIANYSEDCKMLLYAVSCNLAHLYCRKGDRSRAQELLTGLEEVDRWSCQNLI